MAGWTPRVIAGEEETRIAPETIDAADEARGQEERLLDEAHRLARSRPGNAYSDYILKHRKRPPKEIATTIGRLHNWRVRADDGRLYPSLPRNKAAVAARKKVRELEKLDSRLWCAIRDIRTAVTWLSEIADAPAVVARRLTLAPSHQQWDEGPIRERLPVALDWLERFASELSHGKPGVAEGSGGAGQGPR